MGYPVVLSIFLCLIGGLAGGLIHEWWRSKDTGSIPTPISDTSGTDSLLSRFQRKATETRAEKWQKHSSRRKRKALKARPKGLSWPFRRKQS